MKKFLLLLCTLLGTAGAWATEYTVTYSTSTGSFTATNPGGTWASAWKSTATDPYVTLSTGANNIQVSSGSLYSGNSGCTYTITAQAGYLITGYTIVGKAQSDAQTLTPAAGGSAVEFGTDQDYTLAVTGLSTQSTSFTQSTPNKGIALTSFTITVENDPSYVVFDPSDVAGKTFTMQCARGYVYWNGSTMKGTSTAASASRFAIVTYNSTTYLYDATQSKFVCHTILNHTASNGNPALESDNDFSKAVTGLSFGETNIAAYPYYLAETVYNTWLNMDGTPNVYFNTWKNFEGGNGGNTYKIEIADTDFDDTNAVAMLDAYFNPSATVTYVISDATGVIYTSEAQPATVGATITELPADLQRPYCTYNVTSATMVAGSNTVNATVTYTLPFTLSANFTDATWYYATIRGSKYLRADESAKDGSGRYQTNTTNEKTDAYKWAFVGNPYNLSIINKAHEGKVLYAGDVPVMQEASPASDVKARWIVSSNSNGGFSVRSESGANLYINDAGGAGNLGYWNSTAGANDNGSNWTITEVPAATVDVTYNLVVGGETVNTIVDEQVAANSDINIPASLTSGYSTLAYDFVTSGSIGTENTTITVTGTLKAGVITALSQLSNAKAYTLNSVRGSLGTNGTQMVSTYGTSYSASNFAIISYESNFYLYSVADSKFVANTAQPALTDDLSTIAALVFDDANATATSPLFFMGMGTNGVNVSNYSTGIVVNSWTTRDEGNQYCIIEAADFDATNALAALEAFFHPSNYYSYVETEIIPYLMDGGNPSPTINKPFGISTAGATTLVSTYMSQFNNMQFTQEEYEGAKAILEANIVYPQTGYYRIKSAGARSIGESYIGYGQPTAGSIGLRTIAAANATNDASTIIRLTSTGTQGVYTLSLQGLNVQNQTSYNVAFPATDAAGAEFKFEITAPAVVAITNEETEYGYLHEAAWDVPAVVRWTATAGASQWSVEEVTELNVNLNNGGDGYYYATLCVPFEATITGATAYTMAVEGDYLVPTEVATIAAGTPVLLKGTAAEATLTIGTEYATAPTTETALSGTYVEKTIDGTTDYVLGKNADAVGFYHWDSNTLAANRAYVAAETGYSVKGFAINWAGDADGIKAIENANNNDVIYNLAGQRVTKAVRGIYVKNGKKVVVK